MLITDIYISLKSDDYRKQTRNEIIILHNMKKINLISLNNENSVQYR